MSLSKKVAFKALAAKARQRAGMSYDAHALLSPGTIQEFLKSGDPTYRHFAEAYDATAYRPGGHPDYNYLSAPENLHRTEMGTITTAFLDLKNFTKYCCFLDPTDVYKAKRAVIEATIGVCRIYEGHLHEIPGDGVMFFFGGRTQTALATARQGLDAATDALKLLEDEVIPEYNDGRYPDIYPKMGIDYGEVLWGTYGAAPHYEVKATAFNVDIAAKMMAQCNAKELALGNSLKDFLKLEQEKYLTAGWKYERQHTVNGNEQKIVYPTWLMDWRKYVTERNRENDDLAKLNVVTAAPAFITSKTKLGDAPLA